MSGIGVSLNLSDCISVCTESVFEKVKCVGRYVVKDLLAIPAIHQVLGSGTYLFSRACTCPAPYLSDEVMGMMYDTQIWLYKVHQMVLPPKKMNPEFRFKVLLPIAETIEFCWLVQDVALRKLPKKALYYIAPAHVDKIDSIPARVARVFISSMIFTAAHGIRYCHQGGSLPQLAFGVFVAIRVESGADMTTIALQHIINNIFSNELFTRFGI